MKKTMMLLLCLLIVVSLFATTALAAAITPRGSEGAAWTNKTIRQTSAIMLSICAFKLWAGNSFNISFADGKSKKQDNYFGR